MQTKIVVITSQFLYHFAEETLNSISPDCIIEVVAYTDFGHISRLYEEKEEEADGFMVSGSTAQAAIEKAIPNHKKPIIAFQADEANLYRILLERFVEKRDLDTRRVILDFLLPIHESATVEYFLHDIELPMIGTEIDEWLEQISIDDIRAVEAQMAQKAVQLWKENQIDLVICQYSSLIPVLEKHGIPYCYPYPAKENIQYLIENLMARIEINRLRENLPAVIAVADTTAEKTEQTGKALKEALLELKGDMALDIILQEEKDSYHMFTGLKVVNFLTEELRICHLSMDLKEKYGVDAAVGYGIGNNISDARGNAREALKEALVVRGSFVVDETHSLIGPLNTEQYMEVQKHISEDICRVAERCKLSTLTIQKMISIIKMTGTNKMTTQDLAERLGVTVRNANRILNNLEKGGAAVIVYTQSVTSKGRPVKVYELNFKGGGE